MNLTEQIANDLKNAMKTGDKFSLGVYRMLKSALQLEQISKKHELSDNEVVSVIKKQVKIRKDSLEEYEKYQRVDLAEPLKEEIDILSKYLPEELSEEKLQEEIEKAFVELKPESRKEMGKVMKLLTERIGNVADMSKVSALVKEKLNH